MTLRKIDLYSIRVIQVINSFKLILTMMLGSTESLQYSITNRIIANATMITQKLSATKIIKLKVKEINKYKIFSNTSMYQYLYVETFIQIKIIQIYILAINSQFNLKL